MLKYFNYSYSHYEKIVKIVGLLLILVIPDFSLGQSSKFHFGIEGGPGLSTLRYDLLFYPSKYLEAGIGGSAGFSLKYDINQKLAVKSNLFWEMKGNTRPDDADYRLNYITIPLLLQIKFGKSPMGFLNFGPYLGYLLPVANDIDTYYKPIDLGVSLGLGLEVQLNKKFSLSFELRNNLGLLNVSSNYAYIDKYGNPVVDIGDLFTQNLVFQTGLIYNIEPKEKR